jgi:oxalate decarboxylase
LIAAVNNEGKNQAFRADKGDIWYFPKGQGHTIQGLTDPGAEYLLVFDAGDFDSKGRTFNVADWIVHTPLSVLAKNFGVSNDTFKTVPKALGSVFRGNVSSGFILSPDGVLEEKSSYHFAASKMKMKDAPGGGGKYLIVDKENFPIITSLATMIVEVKPGAMRELHWHPNVSDHSLITFEIKGRRVRGDTGC